MLRLHHAPRSRSSRIVWLLEELKADCQIVYTTITRQDGSGDEDEANPHPDKKVPALVHDDVLITESSAIVLYLTDLFPEAGLGPQPKDPGAANTSPGCSTIPASSNRSSRSSLPALAKTRP